MSAAPSFAHVAETARLTPPVLALVLGSGMGGVARRLTSAVSVPFLDVPRLAPTSVSGHIGCVTLGEWLGKTVLVFEGRLHLYEGRADSTLLIPVTIASFLGAPTMLFTNAAGGIHDALAPGALMAIRDHMEWNRPYAWRYPGPGGLGPQRHTPYSPRLLQKLAQAACGVGIDLQQGTYAAVTGPNYETPAEIRALRICGADAVGMSTTREVQAAHDLGMECAAVSCITNRAAGLGSGPISHEEVLSTAASHSERLADLLEEFLRLLSSAAS
jgi:purine-nucleoside phosphorylase